MNRFNRTILFGVLGLLVIAGLSFGGTATAQANDSVVANDVSHGHAVNIYVCDLYYLTVAGWQPYSRYFISQCTVTGAVDYGGLVQAQQLIASQGYQSWASAPVFWRTSYNGQ